MPGHATVPRFFCTTSRVFDQALFVLLPVKIASRIPGAYRLVGRLLLDRRFTSSSVAAAATLGTSSDDVLT